MYQDILDAKSRGAMSSDRRDHEVLGGSHRASVPGNQKGTVFLVGYDNVNPAQRTSVPKRLQGYPKDKPINRSDIDAKQKLADERRKRQEENKTRMARKVSEDAIRYDKKVKQTLAKHSTTIDGINKSAKEQNYRPPENRWFSGAFGK